MVEMERAVRSFGSLQVCYSLRQHDTSIPLDRPLGLYMRIIRRVCETEYSMRDVQHSTLWRVEET